MVFSRLAILVFLLSNISFLISWYKGHNVCFKKLNVIHISTRFNQGWYNWYNVADALPRKRQWQCFAGSQVRFIIQTGCCTDQDNLPALINQSIYSKGFQRLDLSFKLIKIICWLWYVPPLFCPARDPVLITRLKRSIINPIGDFPEFLKKCDTLPRLVCATEMFLWRRKYFL